MITINPTTGAGTLVGPLGANVSPTGLAFRGANLYVWDNAADRVRELDPATGATLNSIDVNASIGQEGDIVFRSDGIGYLSGGGGNFYRFDLTVPDSIRITRNQTPAMDGMAFNAAGVMYGLPENAQGLYTIDETTGNTTLVGPTGIPGGSDIGGLAFDAIGNLFAAVSQGTGAPSSLYRINLGTGAATLVGDIGFRGVSGIRFNSTGTLYGITYGAAVPTAGVTVTESAGSTDVAEGGSTDTYTVVLNAAPTANVTITINASPQLSVSPASLTFTPANWNVARTVTVTAADDVVFEGPHSDTITHTSVSADAAYNALAIRSVTANISDNDLPPPPPPPPPLEPEGVFAFAHVAKGREGGFFFGGMRVSTDRATILDGPFVDTDGQTCRVLNRGARPSSATEDQSSSGVLPLALSVVALLTGGALVGYAVVRRG